MKLLEQGVTEDDVMAIIKGGSRREGEGITVVGMRYRLIVLSITSGRVGITVVGMGYRLIILSISMIICREGLAARSGVLSAEVRSEEHCEEAD